MKNTRKKFTVEGSGPFPVDMLRYDACWPESERKSSWIESSIRHETSGVVGVELLTDRHDAPTLRRWESFGWRVTEIDGTPVRLTVKGAVANS